MENSKSIQPPVIRIRPAALFAFTRIFAFLLVAIGSLWLSWHYWPRMIWVSLFATLFAAYRYLSIRGIRYYIFAEYLQVSRGVFFRRVDTVELFRIKDYFLMRPPLLQVLQVMDLQLITTDPVNPRVWLRGIPLSDLVEQLRERVLASRRYNRIYEVN